MGPKQQKSLNQVGLGAGSKYLDSGLNTFIPQLKTKSTGKGGHPLLITSKELEREYDTENYGALGTPVDADELLCLLMNVFQSPRFKTLLSYLQDRIAIFEDSVEAKLTNLKKLEALKPILYLATVERLLQSQEASQKAPGVCFTRTPTLCTEALTKFVEVFSYEMPDMSLRSLLLLLSRASLTLLLLPDVCSEDVSVDSPKCIQELRSSLVGAITELDGLTSSQHELNTLTDPLRQPDYFSRTTRDWILVSDELAKAQSEQGGALGRIRYLFRRFLLAKHATQGSVEPFIFKEQVLLNPSFSIKNFPMADNIRFGVLEINPANLSFATVVFLCLLYTSATTVDLHRVTANTEIRLKRYCVSESTTSILNPTLGDFILATTDRPGGISTQDQVWDHVMTIIHEAQDTYFFKDFPLTSPLTVLSSLPATAYKQAYLWQPSTSDWTNVPALTVMIRTSEADSLDDGFFHRRKSPDEISYAYLYRTDKTGATLSELLEFICYKIFRIQHDERDVYVEELRHKLRFQTGLGSSREQPEREGTSAAGLELSEKLSDIRDRLVGTKQRQRQKYQIGLSEFEMVHLVAIIEDSNKLEFDMLPSHTGKYDTVLKYPLNDFVNHLIKSSVAWDKLDIGDEEQQVRNCLPENLYLDMSFLKRFCNFTRRLEIDCLSSHAEAIGISNKYILENATFSFKLSNTKLSLQRMDSRSSMLYLSFPDKDDLTDLSQTCILQIFKDSTNEDKKNKEAHLSALGLIIEARKFRIAGEKYPSEIVSDNAIKSSMNSFSKQQQKLLCVLGDEEVVDEKLLKKIKEQHGQEFGFFPEQLSTKNSSWALFSRVESYSH